MLAIILLSLAASDPQPPPRAVFEQPPVAVEPEGPVEAVLLHPLFREPFVCGDHAAGEEAIAGDALGTDCQIIGDTRGAGRGFGRLYRTDGKRNEDWYSWGAEVLAPADGVIVGLLPNPRVNEPGTRGKPPAGLLQIRTPGGVVILMAHLTDFAVAPGDSVTAGQVVARVGNNGPSYAPHVHVGASRGATPLQIRWDQEAMGAAP